VTPGFSQYASPAGLAASPGRCAEQAEPAWGGELDPHPLLAVGEPRRVDVRASIEARQLVHEIRHLLHLVGRQDVRVIAGSDLGNSRLYFVDGLFPSEVPKQETDLVSAVADVCASTSGPVRWVGMGPLSNLSTLQSERPDLVARMVVTQMGGAIVYRDPSRAEHNFREDPEAAIRMLGPAPAGTPEAHSTRAAAPSLSWASHSKVFTADRAASTAAPDSFRIR